MRDPSSASSPAMLTGPASAPAPWSPLWEGARAQQARETVRDIVEALASEPPSEKTGFKGDASIALLMNHCAHASAGARLEHALLVMSQQPQTIALFGGMSGVLWLVHQLADGEDAEEMLAHFETILLDYLRVPRWQQRYDLMSGLAGVGVYAAERRCGRAVQIAEQVLAHLEACAITTDDGATWRTPPSFLNEIRRSRWPDGVIDLGVAHGVPGIIGMLARFVEADLEPERSRALLRAAVGWLLRTVPRAQPRFTASWPVDPTEYQRVGWCYGDIGVAAVLLRASRALASSDVQAEALDLLRQAAVVLAARDIPDASFCHGAAGLAHIYNVAFQSTGDLDMRTQAVHWLTEVLRRRTPGSGIAGYSSLKMGDGAPRWTRDPTLLSGVVGIALVLLAAVEDTVPEWHPLFLL